MARLVLEGKKQATAGAFWSYKAENEPLPKPGDYSVITDWEGLGICIIKTSRVSVVLFNQVSPDFAAREGEGDGSLAYWKKVHRKAFTRDLEEVNRTTGSRYSFTEDMPVVCEEFMLVHPNSKGNS